MDTKPSTSDMPTVASGNPSVTSPSAVIAKEIAVRVVRVRQPLTTKLVENDLKMKSEVTEIKLEYDEENTLCEFYS